VEVQKAGAVTGALSISRLVGVIRNVGSGSERGGSKWGFSSWVISRGPNMQSSTRTTACKCSGRCLAVKDVSIRSRYRADGRRPFFCAADQRPVTDPSPTKLPRILGPRAFGRAYGEKA
jgi:hypothetical protein